MRGTFCTIITLLKIISVADPDPGSTALLTPESGTGEKSVAGINVPDHISDSLKNNFLG
jgi:hypothetical protein